MRASALNGSTPRRRGNPDGGRDNPANALFGDQHRRKVFTIGAPCPLIFHDPRGLICDRLAEHIGDQMQRRIDAERDPAAGYDRSPCPPASSREHRSADRSRASPRSAKSPAAPPRALGGRRAVVQHATRRQDHAAGTHRRDALRGVNPPDISERRGRLRLRGPAGTAGDDDEIARRRIVDAEIRR